MNKRILIIEDDEEMCEEITEVLKAEGYQVEVAFDGLKGKKLINKGIYSLLLLDLKIPGVNGLNILRKLETKNTEFKVVVLTARPLRNQTLNEQMILDDEEEKILKKADEVINKPFDIELLLNKIKKLYQG